MKKYIYTYQTKNLVNGKTYIGVHSTNDINDGYIGCGINCQSKAEAQKRHGRNYPFIRAVLKYGYENFKLEVLSFFDTQEEAYEEEEYIVDHFWVESKDNYNIQRGGRWGKKNIRLHPFRRDINKMFSQNKSYDEISKKYKCTKGSWISLITDDSKRKRREISKPHKWKGLAIENVNGDTFVVDNLKNLKKHTGLGSREINKIVVYKKFTKGWALPGHPSLIRRRKRLDRIRNKIAILHDGRSYTLLFIYSIGISEFCKKTKIPLSDMDNALYQNIKTKSVYIKTLEDPSTNRARNRGKK